MKYLSEKKKMAKTKTTKGIFDEEFRLERISSKDPLKALSEKINREQFVPVLEKAFAHIDYSQGGPRLLTDC